MTLGKLGAKPKATHGRTGARTMPMHGKHGRRTTPTSGRPGRSSIRTSGRSSSSSTPKSGKHGQSSIPTSGTRGSAETRTASVSWENSCGRGHRCSTSGGIEPITAPPYHRRLAIKSAGPPPRRSMKKTYIEKEKAAAKRLFRVCEGEKGQGKDYLSLPLKGLGGKSMDRGMPPSRDRCADLSEHQNL